MQLIINRSHNPAFNLAMEEYLLAQTDIQLIMLWRNDRSVIIGKNQNALEEIDEAFVKANDIAVIRRMSGGGAVFHDLGNINYTIITKRHSDDFGGYAAFTSPVRNYLKTLGIDAEFSGRNDLVIEGKKFSGNAQAVKNNRIMHHGCILFDANVADLARALAPKAEKIESKGVKSVRSRVTNVASHLSSPMTPEQFFDGLASYFKSSVDGIEEYALTDIDLAAAQKLCDEKYSKWDWNFGSSPGYDLKNSKRFEFGTVDVHLEVSKGGSIENVVFYGDFFGILDKIGLEDALKGAYHEKSAIMSDLEKIEVGNYIHGMNSEQIAELLCF